jgi:hypothetical protein
MSQVILELSNKEDLILLLSLAKRLNMNIVSVHSTDTTARPNATPDSHLKLMQEAAKDPLFLADTEEVMADFEHSDRELP